MAELQRSRAFASDERGLAWVRVIERSCQQLSGLLDDALAWTETRSLDPGLAESSPVWLDLANPLQEVQSAARRAVAKTPASRNGIRVHFAAFGEPDLLHSTYRVNLHRLCHALGNLVSNAVKFTDNGGLVAVRAVLDRCTAGTQKDSAFLYIQVSDTGVGIADSNKSSVSLLC